MKEAVPIADGPIDGTMPGASYRVPPPGFVDVLIVLDEEARRDMDVVVEGLRAVGLTGVIPRPKLGVVHGEIAEEAVHPLRSITGVSAVRPIGKP